MKYLPIAVVLIILVGCSQKEQRADQLGDVSFEFSVSDEAKPYFDKGLLLLHSFEYEDAREEFEKAKAIDPGEPMIYWGLAMTHYKGLWGRQDLESGREVLASFGSDEASRLSKCKDPIEKAFIKGVEILYGEGTLEERDQKYVDHLARVHENFPDNLEVTAFYSLGLMWADYKNEEYLKLSSQLAQQVIDKNPTHPGALHYKIHANDFPEYATEALTAATKYDKIAPSAAHALHMPSHIYVALGKWNEVVESNEVSYQASIDRMNRKGLDGNARGYHSMAWLHYGYLQQQRFDKAEELLKEMISYHEEGTASLEYMAMMQNQQRIELGVWPEGLEVQDVDVSKLGLNEKAHKYFFNALLAFDRGNTTEIQKNIEDFQKEVDKGKLMVDNSNIAICSNGPSRYIPNATSITKSEVVIDQMNALIAMLENNDDLVEKYLISATESELKAGYDPGPPFIAYPSFEMYGEWFLEKERYEEALVQFDHSLQNRKFRTKALKGKKQALENIGQSDKVAEIENIIRRNSGTKLAMY